MESEVTTIEAYQHNLVSLNIILDLISQIKNTHLYRDENSENYIDFLLENKVFELETIVYAYLKLTQNAYEQEKDKTTNG